MKTAPLGISEQYIMNIIWEKKTCSVREVVIEVQKEKHVAYTTVATIMQRLYDKKLLQRKEHGKGYLYSPKASKASYSRNLVSSFLQRLLASYGDSAIASFAEGIEDLPKEKRDYLLQLLRDYESKK